MSNDMVVFWPPRPDNVGFNLLNSDEDTNGHWGMNWPGKLVSSASVLRPPQLFAECTASA
eukprot:scaffold244862_cov21-Tisochrysis_lutea.AAC.1